MSLHAKYQLSLDQIYYSGILVDISHYMWQPS